MNYQQALDFLYSFSDLEIKPQYRYAPEVVDPTRPARLLGLLGDPQRDYPAVHVAGTKGKGSVSAICASVFRASGLRVGLYTSPHLQHLTERIQVDGVHIGQQELADLLDEIQPTVAAVSEITTFEILTALAFVFFTRRRVDVAVVEVGLGGRLDATNVIRPMVSVITSLSFDHTYLLGDTLAEIATEKGGIIKPAIPVVSAAQAGEAAAVLVRLASERGAPLTVVGRDWWYEQIYQDLAGQMFRAGPVGRPGEIYRLPLVGAHQAHNATVALAALELVRAAGALPALTWQAVHLGLERVVWPGRFQVLCRRPVVVVDGAHNVDAVSRLRETLESLFPAQRLILIFGATADKDVTHMLETLVPAADEIIVTAASHPRAATPEELDQRLRGMGIQATVLPAVDSALARGWEMAGANDVVCITGSLFVVGDALTAWEQGLNRGDYGQERLLAAVAPMGAGEVL